MANLQLSFTPCLTSWVSLQHLAVPGSALVQAEAYSKPVAKIIKHLQGDALTWWRDVGDIAVGAGGFWLTFKSAFLAQSFKPSDSLKARVALQACTQDGLSVEAFASKFKGIANRVVVGDPVGKTTQATWSLRGLNGRIMNRLQSSVYPSYCHDGY